MSVYLLFLGVWMEVEQQLINFLELAADESAFFVRFSLTPVVYISKM